MRRRLPFLVGIVVLCSRPWPGHCEDLDSPDPEETTPSKAFQYDNEYFSMRFGGGLLIDYTRFEQDQDSQDQLDLHPEIGIRDLRGLVGGRTPWKPVIYTLGYMYDAKANSFRFRQTGLRIKVEQLSGVLFLGRTKEGFSTNKLMVGYYGWFNERSAANDAFIPILADGARWTGVGFGNKLVYNIGAFQDTLSKRETFNRNDWQFAARAVWLPIGVDPEAGVLHLALDGRYAGADDGQLQYKSKPEAFLAQVNAVDTGKFDATRSRMGGAEIYYERGPFATGGEYYVNYVSRGDASTSAAASSIIDTGNPVFHGGDAFASYVFTGETHPYKGISGVFEDLTPKRTFFSGGPGAWELAVRFSHVDLDSQGITGGKFSRATALLNWYLNDALRVEAAYGYGVLDRFDVKGNTQFIQTRVQLQFK